MISIKKISSSKTVLLSILLILQNSQTISTDKNCPSGCLCISMDNAVPASYCDSNDFRSIPQNINPETEILSVTSNRLSKLSKKDFANLKRLTRINLKKNGIQDITKQAFQGLDRLKSLNLGMNMLRTIPLEVFKNLPSLEELYLNDNRLESLPADLFKVLPKLKKLHLQNNLLTDDQNKFTANLQHLEYLDMSNNRLTIIRARMFYNSPNLKSVRFGDNRIQKIESGSFDSLPKLIEVLLNDNEIHTLDKKVLANKSKLSKVTLHGNPLHCDCSLYWIYSVLVTSPQLFNEDKEKLTCHTPSTVVGKPLLELYKEKSFSCKLSVWGEWQQWTTCSKHCGGGQRSRRRTCISSSSPQGKNDCGDSVSLQTEKCNTEPCTVNGLLSTWSSWTNCPPGVYAERSRTRKCINPFAETDYDVTCPGGQLEQREMCYGKPVNGGWSEWSTWSDCSKLCKLGTATRTRTCTNPIPQFNGKLCDGMTIEKQTKVCLAALCPPSTEWGAWGEYSECSVKCGRGMLRLLFLFLKSFIFLRKN